MQEVYAALGMQYGLQWALTAYELLIPRKSNLSLISFIGSPKTSLVPPDSLAIFDLMALARVLLCQKNLEMRNVRKRRTRVGRTGAQSTKKLNRDKSRASLSHSRDTLNFHFQTNHWPEQKSTLFWLLLFIIIHSKSSCNFSFSLRFVVTSHCLLESFIYVVILLA